MKNERLLSYKKSTCLTNDELKNIPTGGSFLMTDIGTYNAKGGVDHQSDFQTDM